MQAGDCGCVPVVGASSDCSEDQRRRPRGVLPEQRTAPSGRGRIVVAGSLERVGFDDGELPDRSHGTQKWISWSCRRFRGNVASGGCNEGRNQPGGEEERGDEVKGKRNRRERGVPVMSATLLPFPEAGCPGVWDCFVLAGTDDSAEEAWAGSALAR